MNNDTSAVLLSAGMLFCRRTREGFVLADHLKHFSVICRSLLADLHFNWRLGLRCVWFVISGDVFDAKSVQ